jgi:serine/threonine protein kinase
VIDSEGYPKIIDFGLAKENISRQDVTKTACGTPEYIAPEIILCHGHSHAADWWSLGCIVYEMLVGLPPFYSAERKEMYRNAVLQPVRFPRAVSAPARDLILGLLRKEPCERLGRAGGREVMQHAWFSDVDWLALEHKQVRPSFVPSIQGPLDPANFNEEFTQAPIGESPNSEVNCEPSLTFGGFSFSPDGKQCRVEMNCS